VTGQAEQPDREDAHSPSARCGWPATPTSPPRCDTPAATLPGRLPCSAWHTDETDITAL
jgi:hypothetical protein